MATPQDRSKDSAGSGRQYQWLLFDADGTLFDYDRAELSALRQVFERCGMPFDGNCLAVYRRINQALWQAFEQRQITPAALKVRRFELLLQELGIGGSPIEFSDRYLQCLGNCAELLEGAKQMLGALHPSFKLALVTNGLKLVQRRRLECSSIQRFFQAVIISEEIGHAKPAGAFFDAAFANMGHPPKPAVLMIGDNWTSDIQGASWYGLDTCWFNPRRGPRPPTPVLTYEISSLNELVSLLLPGKNKS